ncbi:MAG: hypothetical protein H7258_01085 [Ferruginibacter sp.]|nr:hypothetical protein [Ferruginibacter sp.]
MRKVLSPVFLKKYFYTSLYLSFVVTMYGCPYSSPYKIDSEPSVLIEESFIGKWATITSNSAGNRAPVKMIVSKRNEYEYDLSFTGNINDLKYYNIVKDDTLKATAFISDVDSRRFLNIYIKGQSYIAEFIQKNEKVTLLPLCEHFTVKMIKSNAELKQALELHYKTRLYPLYDDEFCLREMSRVN